MLRWLFGSFTKNAVETDKLSDDEIPAYKEELKVNNTAKSLYLYDFKASDGALRVFPDLINECNLQSFTLSCETVGNETAESLVRALANNRLLRRLDFGGSGLTDEGLLFVGEAIKRHQRLDQFFITCSPKVSDTALLQFALQMAENTTLSSYGVHGFIFCPRSSPVINFINDFFFGLIERNKNLSQQDLFFKRFKIYNEFASHWNAIIKTDSQLAKIGIKFEILQRDFPSLKELSIFSAKRDMKKNSLRPRFQNILLPVDLNEEFEHYPETRLFP